MRWQLQIVAPEKAKARKTSLSAGKKGFDIGTAALGGDLFGEVGLIAGSINAEKVLITCLKCIR